MIVASENKRQVSALAAVLAEEYAYDPFGIGLPDPLTDFNRSLKKMIRSGEHGNLHSQLDRFDEKTGDQPFSIFPTREELTDELLPILQPLHKQYPFIRTGLSISNPVGLPETVSLNTIIRLYDSQKHICIKVKFSVFPDPSGRFFYEVGFVNTRKSLFEFEKNFLETDAPKGDYHLLQQLVNCTKKFIRRRPFVEGLDLTPAYYHVLPLCLRLGGLPHDKKKFSDWLADLEIAADHSIFTLRKNEPAFYQQCKKVNRRYIISWLLSNEKLISPLNDKPLTWAPPRLIWKAS